MAREWWTKAALQGECRSQNLLGYMYAWGDGVEKDLERAEGFLTKAAAQGDRNAIELLPTVQQQLATGPVAVPITAGCTVWISGLRSRPELNWTRGKVLAQRSNGRWAVLLEGSGATLALRPSCLTALPPL